MQHVSLARGRWHTMTLAEQLGNIGSEVHRARVARGLELFDLTLLDLERYFDRFALTLAR